MINIFDLWEEFIGTVNTHQAGSVKPHGNFTKWLHTISISMYEEKFKGWGKDQKILDDMSRPFFTSANLQVKAVPGSPYGLALFPENYGHFDNVRLFINKKSGAGIQPDAPVYNCLGKEEKLETKPAWMDQLTWDILQSSKNIEKKKAGVVDNMQTEVPIDKIPSFRWGAALNHRRKKPTLEKPIVTQYDGGLKVAPAVGLIVLDYLMKPTPPKFVYKTIPGDPTSGEGDIMVFDNERSVHLQWTDLVRGEFMNRLETKFGKMNREQFIYQAADNDRKQVP